MTSTPQVPIYYINLASRPDRRAFMEEQFDRLGITAERVDAVTMDEVPAELVAYHASPRSLWRSNPGDLACGLSHQRMWAMIAEAGHREAMILEDDAVLTPPLLDFVSPGLLARLGADLIKLETTREDVQLGTATLSVGGTTLRELCSSHMGSAAYLISRDAVLKSLNSPLKREVSVDRLLFGRGGAHLLDSHILQAWPSPSIQLNRVDVVVSAAASDIHDTRTTAPRRTYLRDALARTKLQFGHAGRLLRLAGRDRRAAFSARVEVPFVGDAPSMAAPAMEAGATAPGPGAA